VSNLLSLEEIERACKVIREVAEEVFGDVEPADFAKDKQV